MNLAEQIKLAAAAANQAKGEERKRFNPVPAGVPRTGSASDSVLVYLKNVSGFRTKSQIILWVNRARAKSGMEALSGKAIDWALLFLRHHKLIDAVGDYRRNSRYLRYRALGGKGDGR